MARVVCTPIVALDVPTLADAMRLVARLGESCDFYKVGSELFTAAGRGAVDALRERGKRVFLDLKFHDIPNTVAAAVANAARTGASLVTVHASGGSAMLRAAVDGGGLECGVLAVTVLTSLDAPALAEAWGKPGADVHGEVRRLAGLAAESGCHGVVCSGQEVAWIRADHGERLAPLVPGVRFAGGSADDQRRVVTPGGAARDGAAYVILGRAVTATADPAAAMRRARSEIQAALAAPP